MSRFYTNPALAVDGEVAEANDVNSINTEAGVGFDLVAAELDGTAAAMNAKVELARKWAEEDENVEVTPGSYSAYHWSIKADDSADAALVSEGLADADRVQTGLDRTQTGLDRTQTGLDKTATAADRVQTGLDRTQTGADRVQTGLDKAACDQAVIDATTVLNSSVKLTGDQSVAGIKTFSSSPVVPTLTSSENSTKAASTAMVQTVGNLCVKLTGDQSVAGIKTHSSSPVVPTLTGTDSSTKAANSAFTQAALNALGFRGTAAIALPPGTTAQRPGSPVNGMIRYNTDLVSFEGYIGSAWGSVGGGAKGAVSNPMFYENDTNVTGDYTITSGKNAMSAGPVTVDAGVTVTVPSGSTWTVV